MRRKQCWAKRVKKERFKKRYLTKQQACRLLQVDSMQFRRLCILKGIYPRAIGRSKQKASGSEKQLYYAREIKWLVHDQLPSKIYAFKAWERKVRTAEALKRKADLAMLRRVTKPAYALDATLKERYPTFLDAVRDVDDAMTNIALYAFMSPEVNSATTIEFHHALPVGLHEKAVETVARWLSFVSKAKALSKGFVSVKGYYYEAVIKGQRVMWLMPHEYASKFPSGVQQYILITFLEIQCELMRFVLFKLERELAAELAERARREDEGDDEHAADFARGATAEDATAGAAGASGGAGGAGNALADPEKADLAALRAAAVGKDGIRAELALVSRIFEGLTFYIGRECPAKHCRFVITACGGRIVEAPGAGVTHHVIDRPQLAPGQTRQAATEYIQPQYLFDCLNARALLPVRGYRLGEELPPHTSPFSTSISNLPSDRAAIDDARKRHPKLLDYVPQRVHEIRRTLDPSYVAVDPTNAVGKLLADDDGDDSDGDAGAGVGARAAIGGGADDVESLDGDELAEARKRPEWTDEKVVEHPERSMLSAFRVRKQRELNLMNQPTSEATAAKRAEAARAAEAKRKSETREQRIKRKVREVAKSDAATRKLQLQVARKKAARYYKMVSGAVMQNKRRESALTRKAKALATGAAAVSADGKTFGAAKVKPGTTKAQAKAQASGGRGAAQRQPRQKAAARQALRAKNKSAYASVPKWVR